MQQAANLQQATILQAAALSAASQNAWNQQANPSQMNPSNDLSKSTTDAQQNWMQQWYFHHSIDHRFLILFSKIGLMRVMMHHKLLLINNGKVLFFFMSHLNMIFFFQVCTNASSSFISYFCSSNPVANFI
jgi:hypothetical protein